MHLARVERGETQICLLLLLVEEAVENFDGVGALLVDVISRMAAVKALDRYLHEEHALGSYLTVEMETGCCGLATGT